MAGVVCASSGKRDQFVPLPLGLEPTECVRRNRDSRKGSSNGGGLRPVPGRGVRASATQRIQDGREGGTGSGLRELPYVDAGSGQRGESIEGRESGKDGDADAESPVPAGHGQ